MYTNDTTTKIELLSSTCSFHSKEFPIHFKFISFSQYQIVIVFKVKLKYTYIEIIIYWYGKQASGSFLSGTSSK